MDTSLFTGYILQLDQTLLTLDNHGSKNHYIADKYMKNMDHTMLTFNPHATHNQQPFGVSMTAKMKKSRISKFCK